MQRRFVRKLLASVFELGDFFAFVDNGCRQTNMDGFVRFVSTIWFGFSMAMCR
jgi:hypothetical protein